MVNGFFGQVPLLRTLVRAYTGAALRGVPAAPIVICGPRGSGRRRTLSAALAQTGRREVGAIGTMKVPEIEAALADLAIGDVFVIDEAPLLSVPASRRLLAALCAEAPAVPPALALLAGDPAEIETALRARARPRFVAVYRTIELVRIAQAYALARGLEVTSQAAGELVRCADPLPGAVCALLDDVLDYAAGAACVTLPLVEAALRDAGYSPEGLDPMAQRYLRCASVFQEDRLGIDLAGLAARLGVSERFLRDDVEPALLRRRLIRIEGAKRVPYRPDDAAADPLPRAAAVRPQGEA